MAHSSPLSTIMQGDAKSPELPRGYEIGTGLPTQNLRPRIVLIKYITIEHVMPVTNRSYKFSEASKPSITPFSVLFK